MKKITLALLMLFCITTFAQPGVNNEKLIRHKGGLVDSLDNGGFVKLGRVAAYYGNIGSDAVDLSTSFQSGEYGATGSVSTAMGINTTASGEYSTAMGLRTIASGEYATAMGNDTKAIGAHSTAMGGGTEASGGGSTAMGTQTAASG
jgi:hypothetical protein